MVKFVSLLGKKMKLGTIFTINTKDVGDIIVKRRISPSSRALAVEYVVKVLRNGKSFVVGIKSSKFEAIQLARKTKERLKLAKKAKEVAIRTGIRAAELAKRGTKLGLGFALRIGRAIEKETRPGKRKPKKKKKRRKKK